MLSKLLFTCVHGSLTKKGSYLDLVFNVCTSGVPILGFISQVLGKKQSLFVNPSLNSGRIQI